MPELILEVETDLQHLLGQATRTNRLSLEDECRRRTEGGVRRSRYQGRLSRGAACP